MPRSRRVSFRPQITKTFDVGENWHVGYQGEKFDIGSLPPEEQKQAKDIAEVGAALLVKGVLHRSNARQYPISRRASPSEVHMANIISAMDQDRFSDLAARIKRTLRSPEKKERLLGAQSRIDFGQPLVFAGTTVDPRLEAPLPILPRIFLSTPIPPVEEQPPPEAGPPPPPPPPPPPSPDPPPQYNRLTLVVAQVRCRDKTDPESGDDNIIFGGVKVEANGAVGPLMSYAFGAFDHDGEAHDYDNIPIAQYDCGTPGFPKLFFAICYLTESDQDDEDAVKATSDAAQAAAQALNFVVPGAGVIAAAAFQIVTGIFSATIDDDVFPPYGIMLELNNFEQWGGNESWWMDTYPITGHGGAYVITYKWILHNA